MTRTLTVAAGALALSLAQAHATASLSCTADDKSLSFEASGVISSGLGGRISNFTAEAKLKAAGIADDLKAITYEGEHLVHSWLSRKELKLLVYREREGEKRHGYVQITIETTLKPKSDGDYRGRYEAEVYDLPEGASEAKPVKLRGAITCSAE